MSLSLNNMLGVYEKTLQLRAKRSELLASNIANADTPGYKAKDFKFDEMLASLKNDSGSLQVTNKNHISNMSALNSMPTAYRIPLQPTLDGNTVDTQVENAKFSENAVRYLATLKLLDGKVTGLLTAIRGE